MYNERSPKSLDIHEIAEAFSSHRFVVTYPCLADEIKWNIVGREELMGREAVIDRCAESAKFLETVSTTFTELKISRGEIFIAVEGAVQFQNQENQTQVLTAVMFVKFRMGDLLRSDPTSLS